MPSQTLIGVNGMVKHGEVWTVSGGPDFAGKARPAVIVQDKLIGQVDSITICPLTSVTDVVSPTRLSVQPDPENGLDHLSHIMVDKISTVKEHKLGQRIGVLKPLDVRNLKRRLRWYLGLAPSRDSSALSE